ncbi:hypothetical protein CC80DRAFT_534833 [Byssothecium circinans]|uniref:Amino acid permease/ SLC12A domain-containing protein n=1 Tax=Byssothecium circinans TaxID=147558 RepID=A0A6A5U1A7_9PLEO|nr:hypothetical protein CC80DRAFT_534833 [Byssothecium circinans]
MTMPPKQTQQTASGNTEGPIAVHSMRGPAGLLICFAVVGVLLWTVIQALGEMSAFIAVSGSLAFGLLGVFGEAELLFTLGKVLALASFAFCAILISAGVIGGEKIRFKFYRDPGAFGGIKETFQIFIFAALQYSGTEMIGLSAGESENPAKDIPKAVKNILLWRIIGIVLGGAFFIAIVVPFNDPNLLHAGSKTASSPFVIAFTRVGIHAGAHVVNVVVLITLFSAINGKILKTSGAFNTISDYVILLLPIHAVYTLQMKKKKKLPVILVFTFGLCAPAFATIGLVVRLQRSSHKDTSWGQPTILLWGLAELTSGNLCISFPEMGPLLRSSTRHHSRNTPRRPTASEFNPYKEPSGLSYKLRKKIRDPFLATSLFGTRGTSTLNQDESYIQLNDVKNDSQRRSGEFAEPKPVRIMVDTEINVKTHEAI